MDFRLLITGLKQVVQITDKEDVEYLKEDEMNNIKILSDPSSQLSILVNSDGLIVTVGSEKEVRKIIGSKKVEKVLNTEGGVALPGFVDAHSHPVFAGDRVHEFAMKLAGATYMEVQTAGGGIHFTTNKTREASEEQLLEEFIKIAKEMVRNGTTTLEAKSGYGLDTETEIKMLRVLSRVSHVVPIEVSATFCGAHAVPNGSTELKQVELICGEMLDKICSEKAKGGLANLENIDVFCEKGVFGLDSTRRILEAGKKCGLVANFHAEELTWIGGVEMGASLQAKAISHLEEISVDGIRLMSESDSVAVLLPSTAFILRLTPPPAREMIKQGVIVALGSDFNPNAYCLAMPMIMHLACVTMHLSLPEALVAATINAAYSLGRGRTHGAIAPGRKADIVVLKAGSWEHIIYRMAAQDTVIKYTIKDGRIVHSK